VRRYLTRHGADENGVYVAFVGAIALRRLNDAQHADELLASMSSAVDPRSWTAHVMAFMQGKLDAASFMNAAHDNGERTEAHTYSGFAALQAGRIDDARTHFQWVKDHGSRNYTEYPLAFGGLRLLGSTKQA
jgi:lipoprotein NlpI